jgi:hypothetical protein
MTIFWVGFGIAVGVEFLGRLGQWGAEEESEEREVQPVSISNGTIFKTLVGVGILDWLFRRKK